MSGAAFAGGPHCPSPTIDDAARTLGMALGLSARQVQIATMLARGSTNKEIAGALGISRHTVSEHVLRACHKAGATSAGHLVEKVIRRFEDIVAGLQVPPPSCGRCAVSEKATDTRSA